MAPTGAEGPDLRDLKMFKLFAEASKGEGGGGRP